MIAKNCLLIMGSLWLFSFQAHAHTVDEVIVDLVPSWQSDGRYLSGTITMAWSQAFYLIEKARGGTPVSEILKGESFTRYVSRILYQAEPELATSCNQEIGARIDKTTCVSTITVPPLQEESVVLGSGHIRLQVTITCPPSGLITFHNHLLMRDFSWQRNSLHIHTKDPNNVLVYELTRDKPEVTLNLDGNLPSTNKLTKIVSPLPTGNDKQQIWIVAGGIIGLGFIISRNVLNKRHSSHLNLKRLKPTSH